MLQNEKLSGPQLKAAAVALAQFQSDQRTSDIAKFAMLINETPEAFEEILVPLPVPGFPYPRGGATRFGQEVHYRISRNEFEIVRTSYGR